MLFRSSDPAAVGEAGSEIENLPTVVLQELDVPVIGVINGAAAGYGLDLALGCDMRIGSTSTRLLPGFAKRGVVPESGGTRVSWSMEGPSPFIARLMGIFMNMERMIGRSFEEGLAKLKALAEA